MTFIGTTNELNQFSQDVSNSFYKENNNKSQYTKDYCDECDKDTEQYINTWMCPVDGKQSDYYCCECEDAVDIRIKG